MTKPNHTRVAHKVAVGGITAAYEQDSDVFIKNDSVNISPENNLECVIVEPKQNDNFDTMFYIPGSASEAFAPEATIPLCTHIASVLSCRVIIIFHRTSPDNKHPIPYNDVVGVINYYIHEQHELVLNKIGLAAYSSGGLLALLPYIHSINAKLPFCQLFLIAPAVNLDGIYNAKPCEKEHPNINQTFLRRFVKAYLQEGMRPDSPEVSPFHNDIHVLGKIPPITIVVGEDDIIFEIVYAFYEKLKKAKVNAEIIILKECNHTLPWVKIDYLHTIKARVLGLFQNSLVLNSSDIPYISQISNSRISYFSIAPNLNHQEYLHRVRYEKQIEQRIVEENQSGCKLCICGASGNGKSTLVNYMFAGAKKAYRSKLWFDASDQDALAIRYIEFARSLQLFNEEDTVGQTISRVKLWLEQQGSILVVYDDVQPQFSIEKYIPESKVDVIITSIKPLLPNAIEITKMEDSESNKFAIECLNRFGRETIDDDLLALKELSVLIQSPLAIIHMASYLAKTKIPAHEYLTKLSESEYDPDIFAISLLVRLLKVTSPHTFNLLKLCAVIASTNIPMRLFSPDDNEMLSELFTDSLIICSAKYQFYSIHKIVQNIVQDVIREEGLPEYARVISEIVYNIDKYVASGHYNALELFNHLKAIDQQISKNSLRLLLSSDVLILINYHLAIIHALSFNSELGIKYARAAYNLCMQLPMRNFEMEHNCLMILTNAYWERSDIKSGLEAANMSLELCSNYPDEFGVNVKAKSQHNIGIYYHKIGALDKAEQLLQSAISSYNCDILTEAEKKAKGLIILGFICVSKNACDSALKYCAEAETILTQLSHEYDEHEPADILSECRGQAYLLIDAELAIEYLTKSLRARKIIYSDKHRLVAETKMYLGVAHTNMAISINYLQAAIEILYALYKVDNTYIADCYFNIGKVMLRNKSYTQARFFLDNALAIYQRYLPSEYYDNHYKIVAINALIKECEQHHQYKTSVSDISVRRAQVARFLTQSYRQTRTTNTSSKKFLFFAGFVTGALVATTAVSVLSSLDIRH